MVCKASKLDSQGGLASSGCSGIQGIYDQLTKGVHLSAIYIYIYIYIYMVLWYTRHLCSIDRGSLDLAMGVAVFKASIID